MRIMMDGRLLASNPSGVRDISLGLVAGFRELQSEGLIDFRLVGTKDIEAYDDVLPAAGFMHIRLPIAALKWKADRLIVPRQTVPFFSPVPATPVFMDIGFLRIPEKYSRHMLRDLTTKMAARARSSLAISDYTALEIARHGLSQTVRPLPIQAIHKFGWNPDQDDPYVLCVAAQEPHKNLVGLVQGWSKAALRSKRLVICGRPGASSEELNRAIEDLAVQDSVSVVSGLNDLDYEKLLSRCYAYIQPSFDEGLCIPALDLAAAGAPTVVSRLGNLGHFYALNGFSESFDPYSTDEIASALRRVTEDESFRTYLMSWNAKNVGQTDWKAVASIAVAGIK